MRTHAQSKYIFPNLITLHLSVLCYSTLTRQFSPTPPNYLSGAVHSLLLSTLLQPSAVFLALWYIVRLPIFFASAGLSADYVKEIQFRAELLGDANAGSDREGMEASAPFKLILLGCMLANKWLDDHTFSNKTWYISCRFCFALTC